MDIIALLLSILPLYFSPPDFSEYIQEPKETKITQPKAEPKQEKPAPRRPVAEVKPKPAPELARYSGVLGLINQSRQSNGLNQLTNGGYLNSSALAKCKHMFKHNYWAHSGGGRTWDSFIDGTGQVGEILAKDQPSISAQHTAWLNSPTHYSTMMMNWTHFGYAVCNASGHTITVVHFN